MQLRLKRGRNGKLVQRWYAEGTVNGRRCSTALNKWDGEPPASGNASDYGDWAFEQSRAVANAKMRQWEDDLRGEKTVEGRKQTEARLAKSTLAVKYGVKPKKAISLESTPEVFEQQVLTNLRANARGKGVYLAIVQRFVGFVRGHAPRIQTLEEVKPEEVEAFLASLTLSNRTWNYYLFVLKMLFKGLLEFSPTYEWIRGIKKRDDETISRELFGPAEIIEIIGTAARIDPLIKSMVVIASCTGLRLKDICLLRWASVDFAQNLITLKTHKTKGEVILGMWATLAEELRTLADNSPHLPNEFVLPEAAAQYKRNPDTLLDRLKRVLLVCGYGDAQETTGMKALPPCLNEAETRTAVATAISECDWTEHRKTTAQTCFDRYAEGKTLQEVAAELGLRSKGTVCDYLTQLETLSGCAIIRRSLIPLRSGKGESKGALNAALPENGGRAKRASLRGWHSFRGSFVVSAIRAGVKMEVISKIMGSKTVEIIYKHYIKIDSDFMREAFTSKAPAHARLGIANTTTNSRLEDTRSMRLRAIEKEIQSGLDPRQTAERILDVLGNQ